MGIIINGKSSDDYFARPVLRMLINQPLVASDRKEQFDVICSVTGGGLSGQAGAVRHGISKALVLFEPELKKVLKSGGFLTRDSRVVERKNMEGVKRDVVFNSQSVNNFFDKNDYERFFKRSFFM